MTPRADLIPTPSYSTRRAGPLAYYPDTLQGRRAPTPDLPIQSELAAPRARVVTLMGKGTNSTRETLSSGPYFGPAIIRGLQFWGGSPSDPPQNVIEIGWAQQPIREKNVPLATPRTYTLITELVDDQGVLIGAKGAGIVNWTNPATKDYFFHPLNLILLQRMFFLCVAYVINVAISSPWIAVVHVVEGISEDALASGLP